MKRKRRIYLGITVLVIIILIFVFSLESGPVKIETVKVPVSFGSFQINVTTTGELEAKSSEKIYGPRGLRNFRIFQVKIEDIIPDGTVVDSGEYVAELDKSEISNVLKDRELDLEQLETQYVKTELDTTLQLREARDDLINLKYNLEERQIAVDQSIYEPPATQRQVKIELDKAQRNYEQALNNYKVKKQQAKADMQEVTASLTKAQNEYDQIIELLGQFTIKAPKAGMVIYRRSWDGQKQGIGATMSIWDPVVAELPDLKKMISKTYVNEIDISKVKAKQEVEIGVDAFPDKNYTGNVTEVANIGEQLRNSNAKVFEVIIEVNEYDSILRPAMTTNNKIITDIIDSVYFIPIECVQSNDSITYVYTSRTKQQVVTGKSNENEIIIRAGIEDINEVYLIPPEDAEDFRWNHLDTAIVNRFKREDEKLKPVKMEEDTEDMKKRFMPPKGMGGDRKRKP
jgi:hypothetical protein